MFNRNFTKEEKEKISNSLKGRQWYHNGLLEKKLFNYEVTDEWTKGRINWKALFIGDYVFNKIPFEENYSKQDRNKAYSNN